MADIIALVKEAKNATYYGTADTVLSIIANVTLVILYLSPVTFFWRMIKKGPIKDFIPCMLVFHFLNCGLWRMYASLPLVTPFYCICLQISNSFGMMLSLFYILTLFFFTEEELAYGDTFIICVVCVATGIVVFWAVLVPNRVLGPACVIYGIFMHVCPLCSMEEVYKTKNLEHLPFWFSMASFLNGVVWIIYVCVSPVFDIYIAITNGVGTFLGLIQLIVYYRCHVMNLSRVNPQGVEAA